ncbi:prolyl oligopeptidase [Xylariomycetidae sp. FL2044]|nr:prolyl oligopeptidase [Xylariomycetidae sp. FL2044]
MDEVDSAFTNTVCHKMIVEKFTPEALVSAPRRGPAAPNYDGTRALYTESTHHIGGETSKEIRVMDLATGNSRLLFDDPKAFDATWLGDQSNTLILLKSGDGGSTLILSIDADTFPAAPITLAQIPAPVRGLKVKALKDGTVALAVAGLVDQDGHLFNPDAEKKSHTGKVYDGYRVREWKTYMPSHKYSLWYSSLTRQSGKWEMSSPLHNALECTNLGAPAHSSIHGFGDPRNAFDISHRGIIFAAEEPNAGDPRVEGSSDVYHAPLDSFASPRVHWLEKIDVQSEHSEGSCSQPRFSPDGSMIAFLRSPKVKSERRSIYIQATGSQKAVDVFTMITGKPWPLTPRGFEYSANGHFLYITAADCGRVGLYSLDLQPNAYPATLLQTGSAKGCYPLGQDNSNKVLVSSSSFVESSLYQVIDHNPEIDPVIVSSATNHGAALGLSQKQVADFYFEADGGDYCVHSWMVKPRHFDPKAKYPLALLVHGGPIGAWLDEWNTRWNAAVWAEQGYVVVLPNITGSLGYGLEFSDAVRGDWGGRPYEDLVNCMRHLENVPYIDLDNAVIAGASYGGYLTNWVQGQPLADRFKAMVSHAGIFNTPSFFLQTDLCDPEEHFGGASFLWENPKGLRKHNPAHPDLLRKWKTPMLVVHGDRDYSVPLTEGLAAFHTLQARGVPSRFLTFSDEGHWVVGEENSLEWHRQVFDWLNKYSGARGKGRTSS